MVDRAYAPLRLEGEDPWTAEALDAVWQLWTPNKALGLTGVRGAYLVAPRDAGDALDACRALAPSWPLGAHAVAMLEAWCTADVARWLQDSRATLRGWKAQQVALCREVGWSVTPSQTNFFCAAPPARGADGPVGAGLAVATVLDRLRRRHGIRLRDAASFGLPGQVRMAVLAPQAQHALADALRQADTIG